MWMRTEPLLGLGGPRRGYRGLWEEESGVSCKWGGGGGASSELQAGARHRRGRPAAATSALGPVRICTREKELPARVPATLPAAPTPIGARAPSPAGWQTRARAASLAWPPRCHPRFPEGPASRKVSASEPGEEGETEARTGGKGRE